MGGTKVEPAPPTPRTRAIRARRQRTHGAQEHQHRSRRGHHQARRAPHATPWRCDRQLPPSSRSPSRWQSAGLVGEPYRVVQLGVRAWCGGMPRRPRPIRRKVHPFAVFRLARAFHRTPGHHASSLLLRPRAAPLRRPLLRAGRSKSTRDTNGRFRKLGHRQPSPFGRLQDAQLTSRILKVSFVFL